VCPIFEPDLVGDQAGRIETDSNTHNAILEERIGQQSLKIITLELPFSQFEKFAAKDLPFHSQKSVLTDEVAVISASLI
jgi:hypothetical protein